MQPDQSSAISGQQSAVSSQQSAVSSQQYRQVHASVSTGGRRCFHCGAAISVRAEVCPVCGRPTNPNVCTFCGAPMEPDDRFCAECGNSREGHVCPQCGTLNFRSFCRKCNTPLDYIAQEAIRQAQSDPKYQRVLELHQRVQALEKKLLENAKWVEQFEYDFEEPDEPQELSEQDKALMNEYEQLMQMLQGGVQETKKPDEPAAPREQKKKRQRVELHVNLDQMQELVQTYKQTVQELNDALSDMMPDAGMTPQMQRNYYAARQLPDEHTSFVCRQCGNRHTSPAECSEPAPGGGWSFDNQGIFGPIAQAIDKLIDITVSDVLQSGDYGDMPKMDHDVMGGGPRSKITVGNETDPHVTIRVLYDGPEKKQVDVPYGEQVTFDLANGKYSIVAHTSDRSIRPYAGKENLTGGAYSITFIIEYY